MSGSDPAPPMDEPLEVIGTVTREMVDAARDDDIERVLQLLELRGRAIAQLQSALMAHEKAALDRGAERAEQAIRRLMERVQSDLHKLGRDSVAVRSYSANSTLATALDRSG